MRTTLPARAYVDAAWFEAEMERIFAGMWIAAGRAEDLSAPGRFLRRDVAGASILIVRDERGVLHACHNVCRHRGTRLCNDERGAFAGRIQCPYHAWTYGLDGRLLAAPLMDGVEGFDKSDYPLRRVGCDEWDGHVFITLADHPAPLAAQLRDLPERFTPWGMRDLQMVHRTEYMVAANWKLVVQNYNECLHCPVIHPLLNRMHHYLGADNVPTTESYCGGAMGFKTGVETLSSDGKRRRDVLPGLGDRERQIVNYFAIYPNLLLTLHPDYMMTVTIWPEAVDRTRLIAEWHFHPDEMAKPGFVFDDAVDFWEKTNREDWTVSEQSYRGIRSRGYVPGPYSNRETQLWEFDRFVLSRVNRSSGDREPSTEG